MKFYLCSDHFTNEAFLNPEVEDKRFLRLNRTISIPLPTIFEDNFMKNVKQVAKNSENFLHHAKIPEASPANRFKKNEKELTNVAKANNPIKFEYVEEFIDEDLEITAVNELTDSVDINAFCRLCTKESEQLVPIFDETGQFHDETVCFKLMPQGLVERNDGLPQYACTECLERLQSCASIIDGFVVNQNLFVSE